MRRINIDRRKIADVLATAFEGGSNYWIKRRDYIEPASLSFRIEDEQVYRYIDYPLNEGGAVVILDRDGNHYTLNLDSIAKAIVLLQEEFPLLWGTIIEEKYNAESADLFLQFCVFAEIVYA